MRRAPFENRLRSSVVQWCKAATGPKWRGQLSSPRHSGELAKRSMPAPTPPPRERQRVDSAACGWVWLVHKVQRIGRMWRNGVDTRDSGRERAPHASGTHTVAEGPSASRQRQRRNAAGAVTSRVCAGHASMSASSGSAGSTTTCFRNSVATTSVAPGATVLPATSATPARKSLALLGTS